MCAALFNDQIIILFFVLSKRMCLYPLREKLNTRSLFVEYVKGISRTQMDFFKKLESMIKLFWAKILEEFDKPT